MTDQRLQFLDSLSETVQCLDHTQRQKLLEYGEELSARIKETNKCIDHLVPEDEEDEEGVIRHAEGKGKV